MPRTFDCFARIVGDRPRRATAVATAGIAVDAELRPLAFDDAEEAVVVEVAAR